MKIKALLGAGLAFARKHEGTILTVVSISSTLASVYFAVKDSPKLMAKLDEMRGEDLTNLQKAKEIAPIAARTLVATGVSVGCQLLQHKNAGNLSNAVMFYKMLSDEKGKAIEAQEKATEEIVGKEKAEEIKEKVVRNKAATSYSMFDYERAEMTGHGNELLYFEYFDKWFFGSYNYVETVINKANNTLNQGGPVTVGSIFRDLGLKTPKGFDALGWKEYEQIEITPYAELNEDNKPYITIHIRGNCEPASLNERKY